MRALILILLGRFKIGSGQKRAIRPAIMRLDSVIDLGLITTETIVLICGLGVQKREMPF